MSPRTREAVRVRADRRCEYCHFHEEDLPLWPFHIDHVVPEQHFGASTLENLAWACQRCNLCKGTNLAAVDAESGKVVRLFSPRTDRWDEHFALRGNRIIGRTPIGRATVGILQMNRAERMDLRTELTTTGQWPIRRALPDSI